MRRTTLVLSVIVLFIAIGSVPAAAGEGRAYTDLFAAFSAPGPERIVPNPSAVSIYAELGGRYAEEVKKLSA